MAGRTALYARPMCGRRSWAALTLSMAACAAAPAATPAASAPAAVKRISETVELYSGRTTTVNVPYPDALEYAGARYAGRVRIIGAPPQVGGPRPRLGLIRVLSSGPALGGSELRVRIRNSNPGGTLAARAVVTAITYLP